MGSHRTMSRDAAQARGHQENGQTMNQGASPGTVYTPEHSHGAQTDTRGHWDQQGAGSRAGGSAPCPRPGKARRHFPGGVGGLTFQRKCHGAAVVPGQGHSCV